MKLSNLGNETSFIEGVDNKIKDQNKMWFKTRKLFMIFSLTSMTLELQSYWKYLEKKNRSQV